MNTQEIIDFVAKCFLLENGSPAIDYHSWLKVYRTWECYSQSILKIKEIVPLREPVVKLIYKAIYYKMPFDREYIIKNYESQYQGVDYLLYPSENATQLVVILSGYSERKTYNRYSWFWDEEECWARTTAYLFLNDTENTWYCGHGTKKLDIYKDIINSIITKCNLSNEDTFIVGGSMGGYAAIRLGLELRLGGIISINPQTSIEAAALHNDKSWYNSIKECGDNFIPVCDIIQNNPPAKIYLECGKYIPDSVDIKKISAAMADKGGLFILNHHSSTKHVTSSPSKQQLDKLIYFFSDGVISNIAAEEIACRMNDAF